MWCGAPPALRFAAGWLSLAQDAAERSAAEMLYQFQPGIGKFPTLLFETATHSFAVFMIPFPNSVGLRQRRLGF